LAVDEGWSAATVINYPLLVSKQEPDEQYTPRGAKIPIPQRGEFDANLDKLLKAPAPPRKVLGLRRKRKDASPVDQ
jgi:hypothetical protein